MKLSRLCFCEIDLGITKEQQLVFEVIDGEVAFESIDIFRMKGGSYAALVLNKIVQISGRTHNFDTQQKWKLCNRECMQLGFLRLSQKRLEHPARKVNVILLNMQMHFYTLAFVADNWLVWILLSESLTIIYIAHVFHN